MKNIKTTIKNTETIISDIYGKINLLYDRLNPLSNLYNAFGERSLIECIEKHVETYTIFDGIDKGYYGPNRLFAMLSTHLTKQTVGLEYSFDSFVARVSAKNMKLSRKELKYTHLSNPGFVLLFYKTLTTKEKTLYQTYIKTQCNDLQIQIAGLKDQIAEILRTTQ